MGDHGIAIMSVREGLEFETVLESDCASLADLTRVMLEACPNIRCMRDSPLQRTGQAREDPVLQLWAKRIGIRHYQRARTVPQRNTFAPDSFVER